MGRFTKRVIGGLTAALTLAGAAVAGEYLVTDFDNGTNQHNLGYYYYYYGSGDPDKGNVEERKMVVSAGPADEYGPMSYYAQGVDGGTACKSTPYCGALRIAPLPKQDDKAEYYPAFGFGLSLTKSDTTGYGPEFEKVRSIEFYAMTETPGVVCFFKLETIDNSPNNPVYGEGYRTDFPTVDKSNKHTNSYMVAFEPQETWTKHTISIYPYTSPKVVGGPGTTGDIGGPTADTGPAEAGGKVGDLMQAAWYGKHIDYKPKNVTKIAFAINSDAQVTLAVPATEANVYVDDIKFIGPDVDENFYLPPWTCGGKAGCTSNISSIPTPSKVLSTFEGSDDPDFNSTSDYLRNSRGYYWYSYTDEASRGSDDSFIDGLIENEHIAGNMIMNTTGKGSTTGGRGAWINFETGDKYVDNSNKTITAFVGIGANLFHDTTESNYLNAGAFDGIYFEYKTNTAVKNVSVELTDWCDAKGASTGNAIADSDGEVFFTQIPGTAGSWKAAKIKFTDFVLPTWVETNGTRRTGKTTANACPTTLDKSRLAQLKFKVEGNNIIGGDLAIDNVYFTGATSWGAAQGVRFANSKVQAVSGLRATYNRGVVGVNWNAAQGIQSGKVSLVNVKGRTVATAPLNVAGGKVTANLSKGTIPTGMYFVRINARDVQGKKVVQQVPLSIVK